MRATRWTRYLAQAFQLIKARRFKMLWEKGSRLVRPTGPWITQQALLDACAEVAQIVCILDGAQGGGASLAADQSALHWRDRGYATFRLGANPMGQLTAALHLPESMTPRLTGRLHDWPVMPAVTMRLEVHSLAGFLEPAALAARVAAFSQQGIALVVYWHDHFMACPTRHLLDKTHRYCGLPEVEACAACLPHNKNCLEASLRQSSLTEWRDQWGAVLSEAQEIRVFSPSSSKMLAHIWPDCVTKVVVVPHTVAALPSLPIATDPEAELHVGVIGHIGRHKGSHQVAALAQYIAQHALPARITVFGTLEAPAPSSVVTEMGAYRPADLSRLCSASGVNVFWFPSIWPETFSFVLHEMKAMGLPILAYDVGAQADYVTGGATEQRLPLDAGVAEILEALSVLKAGAT